MHITNDFTPEEESVVHKEVTAMTMATDPGHSLPVMLATERLRAAEKDVNWKRALDTHQRLRQKLVAKKLNKNELQQPQLRALLSASSSTSSLSSSSSSISDAGAVVDVDDVDDDVVVVVAVLEVVVGIVSLRCQLVPSVCIHHHLLSQSLLSVKATCPAHSSMLSRSHADNFALMNFLVQQKPSLWAQACHW